MIEKEIHIKNVFQYSRIYGCYEVYMLVQCTLEALCEVLKKESMICHIEKRRSESETDHIVIDMGLDDRGRPQFLEIAPLVKLVPGKRGESKPNFLQIEYFYPFECMPHTVNQLARYLLLLNKTLDFTGFFLSESDHMVYFRHDLCCPNSKVDMELLKGLLGYILLTIDSCMPAIEGLAGTASSRDLLVEHLS